jgi:hypothetical protein
MDWSTNWNLGANSPTKTDSLKDFAAKVAEHPHAPKDGSLEKAAGALLAAASDGRENYSITASGYAAANGTQTRTVSVST